MKRLFSAVFCLLALFSAFPAAAASRTYAAVMTRGETEIEMEAGSSKQITLTFRNSGRYAWKGTGKNYVSLYATGPYKRKSVFRDASWNTAYQAERLGQASVTPGKTGSVTFTLHAPEDAGSYTEQFQLAVENAAWIYGSTVRLTIRVLPVEVTQATPVHASAYAVIDAETGELLSERAADQVRSIASITKLMSIMVARETGLSQDGETVLMRQDEVGGGRLKVRVGTKLSIRDLIASAMIGSANNATNAVARATGLPKEVFIQRMGEKAKALGLASTSFVEPTGIEAGNVSTAREVALLAKTAFEDPWVRQFDLEQTYSVATSRGPHVIKNTNKLMNDETLVVSGGKTGFTYEAGYSFVTRLSRPGKRGLIVTVLGCDSFAQAFREARILAEKTWLSGETALAQ